MEQPYRTETKVSSGGKVIITGVPFAHGEEVEVVISRKQVAESATEQYPLRGKPIRYIEPHLGVAEDEWEAIQ